MCKSPQGYTLDNFAEKIRTEERSALIKKLEGLEDLLYRAVRELQYVQDAEDFCLTKSGVGQLIIEKGMLLLKVQRLEGDSVFEERELEATLRSPATKAEATAKDSARDGKVQIAQEATPKEKQNATRNHEG